MILSRLSRYSRLIRQLLPLAVPHSQHCRLRKVVRLQHRHQFLSPSSLVRKSSLYGRPLQRLIRHRRPCSLTVVLCQRDWDQSYAIRMESASIRYSISMSVHYTSILFGRAICAGGTICVAPATVVVGIMRPLLSRLKSLTTCGMSHGMVCASNFVMRRIVTILYVSMAMKRDVQLALGGFEVSGCLTGVRLLR